MNGRNWSEDDKRRLMLNSHLCAKELAPLFDRTAYSVWCKMWQLNGGKRGEPRPSFEKRRMRKPVQTETTEGVERMMALATRRPA